MENNFDTLVAQIISLLEMYKQNLEMEQNEHPKECVRPVGRPKKFETPEERKKFHQEKLKDENYSKKYYHKNKTRIQCKYCNKEINSMSKTSHYKTKVCKDAYSAQSDIREMREKGLHIPRVLTSRINK